MSPFRRFLSIATFTVLAACGGGPDYSFDKQTPLGVEYAVIREGQGPKPTKGQFVVFVMEQRRGDDRVVLESKGRQVYSMLEPKSYGDLADLLGALSAGDSVVFRLDAEKIYRLGRPSIMEGEDYLYLYVSMREVMSEQDFIAKENAALRAEMQADIDSIQAYLQRKGITDYQTTETGMFYRVEARGPGKAATPGEQVRINYDGYLPDDSRFESREERGGDVMFEAGRRQLIRAFDEAVMMFPGGSKVTLWVPSKLAYGHGGLINKVASDQWVWFEVDIDDKDKVLREQQTQIEAYLRRRNVQAIKDTAGFYYRIDQAGTGPYPTASSKVTLHYTGMLMDGTVFDSSRKRPEPATFSLEQVIPGWTLGIAKFNAGSRGTLYIPSPLGYGERGFPPNIPPNAILIFDVEVISFR
jgi:FKBP-type peptidyl-prolyl cis-trans isomerase